MADTQSGQSRDSPIGGGTYSIVNENGDNSASHADGNTSATKHTHRKSLFQKRGTSSPSMVRRNKKLNDVQMIFSFNSFQIH